MAALLLMGCDNTIEPFAKQGTYSIYGYLETSRDQQFIRVKPLTVPVSKVDSSSIDATVTLENLTDGTSEVLQDSIITYKDAGSTIITHNFWTDTPIKNETEYRLSIERPDGNPVRATTRTPTQAIPDLDPEEGNCRTSFTVLFKGVKEPRRIQADLEVKYDAAPQEDDWVQFSDQTVFKTSEGQVVLMFSPGELIQGTVPSAELPPDRNPFCWMAPACLNLDSDKIRLRYSYLGPQWFGEIPEDSLEYDPLKSEDVENGLGFFGSLRRDQMSVTVDTTNLIPLYGPICNH